DIKLLEVNPSQVVNNYITTGDINVNQGHALIGNTIGADANISYNTTVETITEEEHQAQIEIPPKN
ncbi:21033_t:CDS:1, partial [Entrophospora sp. SA101]